MPRAAFHPESSSTKPSASSASSRSRPSHTSTSTRPAASRRRSKRRSSCACLRPSRASRSSPGCSVAYGERCRTRTRIRWPAALAAPATSDNPASPAASRSSATIRGRAANRAVASACAASRSSATSPNPGVCTFAGESSAPARRRSGSTPTRRSRRAVSTRGAPSANALHHAVNHPGRRNGGSPVRATSASHSGAIGWIAAEGSIVTLPGVLGADPIAIRASLAPRRLVVVGALRAKCRANARRHGDPMDAT